MESALKHQILDLNKQFQELMKSTAELHAPITSKDATQSHPRFTSRTSKSSAVKARYSSYSRSDTFHKFSAVNTPAGHVTFRPRLGLKMPRRERLNSGGTLQGSLARENRTREEPMTPTDFPTKLSPVREIDALKIRSSLPTSPIEQEGESYAMDEGRKSKLKKKMIDSRKVDVVNLGLF